MTYRNAMAHSYGDDVDEVFVVAVSFAFVSSFVPSSDYEISNTKYWRILKFKVYGPELNYILCIFQDCGAGVVIIIIIVVVEQSCLRLISHIFLVFLVYLVASFLLFFYSLSLFILLGIQRRL